MRKIIALILCGIISQNLYGNWATIVEINRNTDVVTCEDYNGNVWEFYGCEDWQVGDDCNLVMFDNFTAEVTDDVIIRATYERRCGK